ncbi:hypothetical protein [Laspinema olomoucense]|uniref:Uncharacterized protein n=1 Tax=Laspinema olomoucense D3b TaxID=2953688 RepID=A0ABT2NCX1_9CYAN|nr:MULTISPECIES: hypothetical protein [unclassified Laspinema]MCT7974658.1 hypothetical protein [Laspinema sp. D3d]MCT7980548.1 hypothetical protein [Laspinema sp. D3b]MCT7992613.1 hypothetical protein [Laspinema sp. D3c]
MQALESIHTFPKSSFPNYSVKQIFPSTEKNAKMGHADILPQSDIAELFFSVWQRHEMTEANRQRLKFALLSYAELNDSDYRLINRILHAIKRGWIKMVE